MGRHPGSRVHSRSTGGACQVYLPADLADASEIENLATITCISPGRLLLDRAADDVRSTWSLDTAFEGRARDRNPVLDEAWDSYPWASAARAYRESS
jgi:hypothetical protein